MLRVNLVALSDKSKYFIDKLCLRHTVPFVDSIHLSACGSYSLPQSLYLSGVYNVAIAHLPVFITKFL